MSVEASVREDFVFFVQTVAITMPSVDLSGFEFLLYFRHILHAMIGGELYAIVEFWKQSNQSFVKSLFFVLCGRFYFGRPKLLPQPA